MKNFTLKTLAVMMAAVMLLLPVAVFADDEVLDESVEEVITYEISEEELQIDVEATVCTAEYTACAYEYTAYVLRPEQVGIYTVSCEMPVGIVSYNSMWLTTDPTEETVNASSVEWKCTSVGQGIIIAVHTAGVNPTITVTYAPVEIVVIETVIYENKTTPVPFEFEEDATALVAVDTLDTVVESAVLGEDGLYHLNSATGPRLFAEFDDPNMSLSAVMEYGQLKVAVFDEDGNVDHYVDYNSAFGVYFENCDSATKLYPLTDDLIEIYREVGNFRDWYGAEGWIGGTEEDAWMFACRYFEGESFEEEVWPITDPAALAELAEATLTANGRIAADFTSGAEQKLIFAFTTWKAGFYTVKSEGSAAKEIWIVDSNGEILSTAASFELEAAAGETYYVLAKFDGTDVASPYAYVLVNYFSGLAGDVTGDGRVNSKDTMIMKKYLANSISPDLVSLGGLDFDGNGRINSQDAIKLKKSLIK